MLVKRECCWIFLLTRWEQHLPSKHSTYVQVNTGLPHSTVPAAHGLASVQSGLLYVEWGASSLWDAWNKSSKSYFTLCSENKYLNFSVSYPGRMAEKIMLIDHSVFKKTETKTSVHVNVRLSPTLYPQTGKVVRWSKQYGYIESKTHKTHPRSEYFIILHVIWYSVFSTKSLSVFLYI